MRQSVKRVAQDGPSSGPRNEQAADAVHANSRWVLDEACRQVSLWRDQSIAAPVMAVNVSAVQFRGSRELDRDVADTLGKWGLSPYQIEFELTESVLMEATEKHSTILERLRELGVRLGIDDFGTGYSSLKYLTTYRLNRLKLAQELIFRVTVDYRNAAVVRNAVRLAHELGIEVMAEGVETDAQIRFLIEPSASRRKDSRH